MDNVFNTCTHQYTHQFKLAVGLVISVLLLLEMGGQNRSDFDAEYDSAVEWYVSQFDNDAVKEDFKLTKEQEKSRFAAPDLMIHSVHRIA